VTGWWFSPGPPVSSTNETDNHDITEILLKVALSTIKQTNKQTNKQTTLLKIPSPRAYGVFVSLLIKALCNILLIGGNIIIKGVLIIRQSVLIVKLYSISATFKLHH
jgi:hypothetical protein